MLVLIVCAIKVTLSVYQDGPVIQGAGKSVIGSLCETFSFWSARLSLTPHSGNLLPVAARYCRVASDVILSTP